MRKLFYALSLTATLLFVCGNTLADDVNKNTLRFFMSTGEVLDFNAELIDSISTTDNQQQLWIGDVCQTFAVEDIDSVWYMSSALRLSLPSIDFGRVSIGSNKRSNVTITNTSLYPETYRFFADGIFSAKWSGQEFTIGAGLGAALLGIVYLCQGICDFLYTILQRFLNHALDKRVQLSLDGNLHLSIIIIDR